jgi:rare lipoprotein A
VLHYLKIIFLLAFCFLTQCDSSPSDTNFTPSTKPSRYCDYSETGWASWYGPGFHGKKTASGQIYNQHHYTAAHRTLPFHSKVRVTNIETGKSVILQINDRGPMYKKRIIDLSYAAARDLGLLKKGVIRVHVKTIKPENPTSSITLKIRKSRKNKRFNRSIKAPHKRRK